MNMKTRSMTGLAAATMLISSLGWAADPAMEAVDPQERPVLAQLKALGAKPFHTLTPQQARTGPTPKDAVAAVLNEQGKSAAPEPGVQVQDRTIPGPEASLPIRVYTPKGAGPFPVVVYYHGGGFVVANKEVYDTGARALSLYSGAVVVSVDYRLAPEHRYPAALDDSAEAFRYVRAHAADFNGDANRVAVAGESAGGNLATAVAMRQKKSGDPLPIFQLLVYPLVTNEVSSPSHQKNGQGNYIIGNQDIAWFWKNDLGADWKKNHDPEALPIYATTEQLRGLPPALVITAGLDPLKDEGTQYAQKLRAAGVTVDVKNYEGVTHEFFGMGALVDKAKQAEQDAGAALKHAFARPPAMGGSGVNPVK